MQKKILTLAIAAAMVAPAAAMAEATLYGKLNMSIDYVDMKDAISTYYADPNSVNADGSLNPAAAGVVYVDADGNPIIRGGEDFKGWGVSGNAMRNFQSGMLPVMQGRANRIGVKGSEDLGNGLKAIYQVELGLNLSAADNNIPSGNNGISYRNSFVGLAGNWGTALVGRHDTPLKISTGKLDLFSDTMADYNGTVGFDDLRVDNAIAYISPSFSGFSFMGAMVAGGGATAGSGLNVNEDSLAGAYSLAGIYSNGPFYASVAYESLDADMFMNSAVSLAGSGACIDANGDPTAFCPYVSDSYDKWRLGLGLLDWNGFTLTGIYEQQDNIPSGQTRTPVTFVDANGDMYIGSADAVEKQSLWQVQAAYAFGNNTVKAMYGSADRSNAGAFATNLNETVSLKNLKNDLEGDRYTWAIGFDHNFSKRTKAYVLYTAVNDDLSGVPGYTGAEWSAFSAGLVHSF